MTAALVIVVVASWIACGIITAGYAHGYFVDKYPYFNQSFPLVFGLISGAMTGPLSVLPVGFVCGFKHFRLRLQDKEEAWAEHKKQWPSLDRTYFEENWKKL